MRFKNLLIVVLFTALSFSCLGEEKGIIGLSLLPVQNEYAIKVSSNAPAAQSGLQNGDILKKVNNKPIVGLTENDILLLMAGKPGERIDVQVFRASENKLINKNIIRISKAQLIDLQNKNFNKKFSIEEQKQDLDFIIKTLINVHPNLFYLSSKNDFEKKKKETVSGFKNNATRIDFYLQIAPLISSLNDGHIGMGFTPWKIVKVDNLKKIIPIVPEFKNGKMYVKKIYSNKDLKKFNGYEILSINNKTNKYLYATLIKYTFGDTSAGKEASFNYIIRGLTLFQLLYEFKFGNTKNYSFKLKSSDDNIFTLNLSGVSYADIVKSFKEINEKNEKEKNSDYKLLFPEKEIALIEFNSCVNIDKDFKEFVEESFDKIKTAGVKDLIIDIRKNSGGNSMSCRYLIEAFYPGNFVMANGSKTKMSLELMDAWLKSGRYKQYSKNKNEFKKLCKENLGKLENSLQAKDKRSFFEHSLFDGNIYVLIGPQVASSSTMFASVVKDYKIGFLIGNNTGDFPAHYGDILRFKTPNTEIEFTSSSRYFERPNGIDTKRSLPAGLLF